MTVAQSYAHSRAVAKSRAKNFYYAFRLLAHERHQAICAIYAFMRQCDDLSDEAGASKSGLDAWRGQMRRALQGDIPDHPVWPGFADAVQRFAIPPHVFEDMIDGVESDLTPRRIETFEELYRYCYQVASVVGLSVIHIFGFDHPDAPLLAEKCGVAFQLTNILRDVKEDWALGRVYLPAEDMARFGIHEIADSPPLRAMLRFQGERARRYYEESAPLVGMIRPESRASLRALVAIYKTLLQRIEQSGYDVMSRRIRVSSGEKTLLMLRAMAGI
jgi:phytoene synthase